MTEPSREAGFHEIMERVTLADCGRVIKVLAINLGCFGVFSLMGIASGSFFHGSDGMFGSIPEPVYVFCIASVYLYILTNERSYHDWRAQFWLPKASLTGILLIGSYVTGSVFVFRNYGWWLGWATVVPGIMFLDVCQIGYWRLYESRVDRDG